jgi:hypothetical protein
LTTGFATISNIKSTALENNAWFREDPSGLLVSLGTGYMIDIITEVKLFFKRATTDIAYIFISGHDNSPACVFDRS